jgi:mono/diheme cytochrome c family protein
MQDSSRKHDENLTFRAEYTGRTRMRGKWLSLALVVTIGCGGGGGEAPPPEAQGSAAAGLTPFQLEHGIGPVTEPLVLGAFNKAMAEAGEDVFEQKCAACHKLSEKYVGPALGGVTERRSPAFIMNMILNPQEMIDRHPVGKQLLAEHLTFMPNQGLTQDQARQVLEYLRGDD